MEAEIVKRHRGLNLIYNNYRHKKDRLHGTKLHWRCVLKGCPARVQTEGSVEIGDHPTVVFFSEHSHMPDTEEIVSVKVKSKVCQLASMDLLQPLCQVYKNFVTGEDAPSNPDNAIVPDFGACRTMMHRTRRSKMPPVPTSIAEINLEDQWSLTLGGQQFLLSQEGEIIIFATETNLRMLAQTSIVFMDGTFKSAPRLFAQLFTIHGIYR